MPPKGNSGFFNKVPVPGAADGGSQIVSSAAINATAQDNSPAKAYVAPKGVVRPPKNYDDDEDSIEIGGMSDDEDSIEIGYGSDDDEDDVTRRFIRPPQFKKW